ncbi:pilus assembly protein PilN [Bacterioplanes sanyensis]|uniref:Pilus assembly protein PilN n=1 Tax=Bacterioplanes sanyensis TaxID=1249553 RepID=A0A222FEN3_9GAMM|nr:PilN domain-containing protein [Bacterioplanes sanyensis]ASP37468.1 pilus assembly protein PilN [Bacterioplanes sanyensis]
MANINLLPWREERRQQRNQEYYKALFLVALFAGALVYFVDDFFSSSIAAQQQRNDFVRSEMRVIDAKIEEISKLRETREQLIERMELIQALQGNRPVIVRMFDEIAKSVPDDLYFTSISVKGRTVVVKGMAQSNNRVAALMRNFDSSKWFVDPELISVRSVSEGVNEFEVKMQRFDPSDEEEV